MCEKKRRWILKEEKYSKLAFYAYQEFYILNNASTKKTYTDFINSSYYIDFIKFGKHLTKLNVIEPNEFILFVLKSGAKIRDWCKDWVYEEFVRFQTERESYDKAVERNILLMNSWALDTNNTWIDFFRKIEPPLAVAYIKTGRISPWILYNTKTGIELLERMSDEQLGLIEKYIKPNQWYNKFNKYPDDVVFIKELSKKAGF